MNRREVMAGLLSTAALASSAGAAAVAAAAQSDAGAIDVQQMFGFVGDGRTDNYDAFLRWIAHVNRAGGGSYVFPAGTYFVRRYRTGKPGGAVLTPIEGCDGLAISGYGARILLNGNFHRAAREMGTFMPFQLSRCRNVAIRGFEMDGGVRGMGRNAAVTEAYAHLIALQGCVNVTLEDLDLHHSQTDAITLTSANDPVRKTGRACRNITLRKVKCNNNARGGLSVIQALGVSCTDCQFNQSGTGLGRYQGHAPMFGTTIEPDYLPPQVDVRSGDLEFRNCEFSDNSTAVSGVYRERVQGYLRLIDCRSSNRKNATYHFTLNWPGALIQGGVHDGGGGTFWLSWAGATGGDLIVRDCELRTSAPYGIFHAHAGNLVRMENVKIVGTHREAADHGWVLAIQGDPGGGRRNLVRNCQVFIPAARKRRLPNFDYEVSFYHTSSEGNSFRTDLPAAGGQHFCTQYGPGASASRDLYRGASPGPQDSFRPGHNSPHDTRQPYSSS
jgi:hypothetical protein